MQNTTNYGLNKPESTDMYNIEHFNNNADIIDAKLKNHSDAIDGINGNIASIESNVEVAQNTADTATNIAKGKNQAKVFATTEKMYEWLSKEENKGIAQKGDNLYIVDVGVPDWWIAEVLDAPNADGRYYELGQLETQKVDLTTINDAIDEIISNLKWKYWNNAFGTDSITLPEKYEELILEVERGESDVRYPINVTYAQLRWTEDNPGTELCFKAGQCTTSTNYESVSVIATTTYTRIYGVYDGGQNITDASELRVYYR